MNNRRVKVFYVSQNLLIDWLNFASCMPKTFFVDSLNGLPKDATIVSVQNDWHRQSLAVMVHSSEFEVVPDVEEAPSGGMIEQTCVLFHRQPDGSYRRSEDMPERSTEELQAEGYTIGKIELQSVALNEAIAKRLRKPSDTGFQKYVDGRYDELPCTCKPDCFADCKGQCGCEACSAAYGDNLSSQGD